MKRSKTLKLMATPGAEISIDHSPDEYFPTNPAQIQRLFGALLSQAMQDGMTAIRLGISDETQLIFMHYFGPYEGLEPQWWDMVPPPFDTYSLLVQATLANAEIVATVPFEGVIRTKFGKNPVDVRFRLESLYQLLLYWGANPPEALGKS